MKLRSLSRYRLWTFTLVSLILILLAAACAGSAKQARDFEVTQFDGALFQLSQQTSDKAVVLNFWLVDENETVLGIKLTRQQSLGMIRNLLISSVAFMVLRFIAVMIPSWLELPKLIKSALWDAHKAKMIGNKWKTKKHEVEAEEAAWKAKMQAMKDAEDAEEAELLGIANMVDPDGGAETRLPNEAGMPPLFGFAPGGVCPATIIADSAVRSYHTLSPLPGFSLESAWRFAFCGTFPRVTPAGCYPAPLFRGARTFLPQHKLAVTVQSSD